MHSFRKIAIASARAIVLLPTVVVVCDIKAVHSENIKSIDSIPKPSPINDKHNALEMQKIDTNQQPIITSAQVKDAIEKELETGETSSDLSADIVLDEWEEKKKHCSFCRHFIQSPCKLQFKEWSICVETAKEEDKDFVEECSMFTKSLVDCTSANPEYFKETKSEQVEESTEEEHDVQSEK